MKYLSPILAISLIFSVLWWLEGCHHPSTALPDEINCQSKSPVFIDFLAINENQVVIKWGKPTISTEKYTFILENIENQHITKITTANLSDSIQIDTIQKLQAATSYRFYIQGEIVGCQEKKISNAVLFSTKDANEICPKPQKLSIQNIDNDTISLAWYSDANSCVIYMTDSSGAVAFQQTITQSNNTNNHLWMENIVPNLPEGDYSIWVESVCENNHSSLPSDLGVCHLTGGGGPVIVIEDNIDEILSLNCSTCKIQLPANKAVGNCLPPQTVSFKTGELPAQLIIAIKSPNNNQPNCAPIQPNVWRMQSFKIRPIHTETQMSYYQLSLPPISCVCSGKTYLTQLEIQPTYNSIKGNQKTITSCSNCQ